MDDDDDDAVPKSGRCSLQQCRHAYMRQTMFHLCDITSTVMLVSALLYPIIGQLGIAIYRPLCGSFKLLDAASDNNAEPQE